MKFLIPAATHLSALGGAILLGSLLFSNEHANDEATHEERKRRAIRSEVSIPTDDLWRPFLTGRGSGLKRYEELAKEDVSEGSHEEVLTELIEKLPLEYRGAVVKNAADAIAQGLYDFGGEAGEAIARFEATIFLWLKEDRENCTKWLNSLEAKGIKSSHPLYFLALVDYAAGENYEEIRPWLNHFSSPILLELLSRQLKEMGTSEFLADREGKESDYTLMGTLKGAPFQDRERVLEFLTKKNQGGSFRYGLELFLNQADHPHGEVASWLKTLHESDQLSESQKPIVKKALTDWLKNHPGIDFEERMETLRDLGEDNEYLEWNTAYQDVATTLREGRDFRFEFERGTIEAEEVLQEILGQLPGLSGSAEEGLRVRLFRHLAEADYERAVTLLDGFSEEQRRKRIYDSTTRAFINVNPERLLKFSQLAPPPETPQEKEQHLKGWDWRARFFIQRHGDDYVEWVKQMPQGPEKWEALESVIWSTGEIDHQKSVELRREIYGKKE